MPSVDDPNALVECSLDGAAFEACESPHQVQELLPGAHELQVRATDLNGNVGPVASHPWTVVGPPETTIDSGPLAVTSATTATFEFSSDVPGSTFACSLDGAAFTPCTSPLELTGLVVTYAPAG